jgi:hypothetical protein
MLTKMREKKEVKKEDVKNKGNKKVLVVYK